MSVELNCARVLRASQFQPSVTTHTSALLRIVQASQSSACVLEPSHVAHHLISSWPIKKTIWSPTLDPHHHRIRLGCRSYECVRMLLDARANVNQQVVNICLCGNQNRIQSFNENVHCIELNEWKSNEDSVVFVFLLNLYCIALCRCVWAWKCVHICKGKT